MGLVGIGGGLLTPGGARCASLGLPYIENKPGTIISPSQGHCILQTSQRTQLDIEGDNHGAGYTIAGGYGDFFGMLDMNYTVSDLNVADDDAETIVTSARIGWNGRLGDYGGSLWVGAMHQHIEQTLSLPLAGTGVAVIVEQEASSPVNYLIGGRLNFSEEWELLLETDLGLADRSQLMLQFSYRL